MTEQMLRTALYDWHVAHGGRMVPFAGWEMPVQYPTGPLEEHHATRSAAGLFDIDHMAQMVITGKEAEAFCNHLFTFDVRNLAVNDAHYSLMCYQDGGIVDDVFIYRMPDRWFIAINASNRQKDIKWAKAQAAAFDVSVEDVSDSTYMLALQGPKAESILQKLTEFGLSRLERFKAVYADIDKVPSIIARTGYTGEDGFELFFPSESAVRLWQAILAAGEKDGLRPIGLAARDSLRFEPCMPLYGHEINPGITPEEARLTFAVSYSKDFVGRDALLKQRLEGMPRVLIGLEMTEKSVPRHGYAVFGGEKQVGVVTTGMFAPSLQRYLGMALVLPTWSALGTEIAVQIRDTYKKAVVVKRPFYLPVYRR